MKTILLTGKPRCGKSFIVNEIVQTLQKKDLKVGGILTPDIREENERTGFEIIDILSGQKDLLASKHLKSGPKHGPYRVNVEGIDRITSTFLENELDCDLIVIDELGVLELKSARFKKMLDQIFASDKPKLIVLNRHLVKHYNSYGEVIEMNREMQEEIKKELLERIQL